MHDFRVDGLIMTGFVMVVALLSTDDGFRIAGFEICCT